MNLDPDLLAEDSIEDSFPEIWYDIIEENHFWFYWRLKTLLRILKKLNIPLRSPYYSFDIGSGNALLISQLEQISDWSIDGCDISSKFVGELKIKGEYFQYDILKKRADLKEKYDFAFLFDILEHLNYPKEFLEASSYYIKPGGLIFINVPAFQTLYSRYDIAGGHKMRYTKKTITQLVNPELFFIKDIRYWGMTISPLILFRKILTAYSTDNEKILTQGMKTPAKYINSLLRLLAEIETGTIYKPPFGCSLMLTLQKK
jgi:2-polyprenyl-3-methyl-5-hydroxy-6-metoxy-1,4-benzoquinol methylase